MWEVNLEVGVSAKEAVSSASPSGSNSASVKVSNTIRIAACQAQLTLLTSLPQEHAQESHHPIAHRLALLNRQQPKHTPRNLRVEVLFCEARPASAVRLRRLIATGLLHLSQARDQFPMSRRAFLRIRENAAYLDSERGRIAFIGDDDRRRGNARRGGCARVEGWDRGFA